MINYPPKPWEDGQQFKTTDSTGEEIVGTYDASKNAWSFTRLQEGTPGGGIGFVTTEDVNTTSSIPTAPEDWTGLNTKDDILGLNNQKAVNWFLSEAIVENKDKLDSLLWIGPNAPDERDTQYVFWWDTQNLELLVKHNGQWFPVAIPPAQVELLRQELDALYQENQQRRFDIAVTQQELDTKFFEQDTVNQNLYEKDRLQDVALQAEVNARTTGDEELSDRIDALEAVEIPEVPDLSNVAYKDKSNIFTASNRFKVNQSRPLIVDSGSTYGDALQILKYVGTDEREKTIHLDANGRIEAKGWVKTDNDLISGRNVIVPELPTESTHATNKFYTDAQDTIVHGMIDVIIGRRVYAKYQWQKDDRSIRDGKFKMLIMAQHDSEITQANDWEDVNYLYFSYKDYDGNSRSLTEIKVGMQISIESENGACTFIVSQTKVNNLDHFFAVTRVNFVGDPNPDDVYQMVCGDEGRLTAEEVGEIVLNRFNAIDAVHNSYGKIYRNDTAYLQFTNSYIGDGKMCWNGKWDQDMYISIKDRHNFQWSFNTNSVITLPTPQLFSIYRPDGSAGTIGSMELKGYFGAYESNGNHVRLTNLTQIRGSDLYNNRTYIVNLGGFM